MQMTFKLSIKLTIDVYQLGQAALSSLETNDIYLGYTKAASDKTNILNVGPNKHF